MAELTWKKVTEYQMGWTGTGEAARLFLKFDDGSETDLPVHSLQDLYFLGKLLRSGKNIEFSPDTKDFRQDWVPTAS